MTKILVSYGFGAGWSSWNDEYATFFLTYQPFIDKLEAGQPITGDDLDKFRDDLIAAHGEDAGHAYLGGSRGLAVAEVDGPFQVTEYDGSEGVQLRDATDWHDLS